MGTRRVSICVVGNCCHDRITQKDGSRHESLGGSPSFISAVLTALDVDHEIVSTVGADFLYQNELKFAPRVSATHPTTTFIAEFTESGQDQRVVARCEPIRIEDLPDAEIDVALVAGTAGEVSPALVAELRRRSRYVIADAQSLLRQFDEDGRVSLARLSETIFDECVPLFDAIKFSREEARYADLETLRHETLVLITDGERGMTCLEGDREFSMPAYSVNEVDPTGAGDSFVAGLAVGTLGELALSERLELANACGALAVGEVGVPHYSPEQYRAKLRALRHAGVAALTLR